MDRSDALAVADTLGVSDVGQTRRARAIGWNARTSLRWEERCSHRYSTI
jgi:hypothetical protein